jgi:hypothetical protein
MLSRLRTPFSRTRRPTPRPRKPRNAVSKMTSQEMIERAQKAGLKFGKLPNVCNGGEIHSDGPLGTTSPLDKASELDLLATMFVHDAYESKAIMVIQKEQKQITALLEKMARGEGEIFTAERLGDWNPLKDSKGEVTSSLWMIRKK